MRPKSIRVFELLYLGAVALIAANAVRDYDAMLAEAGGDLVQRGFDPASLLVASIIFTLGLMLALWFMTARLRIGFVRYLLVALLVWQAWPVPEALANGIQPSDVIAFASLILQAAALIFAFRSDARDWFASPSDDYDRMI